MSTRRDDFWSAVWLAAIVLLTWGPVLATIIWVTLYGRWY